MSENYNRLNTVSETHQNNQVNGIFLFANARSTVKLHKLSKELMVMWKKTHIYFRLYAISIRQINDNDRDDD